MIIVRLRHLAIVMCHSLPKVWNGICFMSMILSKACFCVRSPKNIVGRMGIVLQGFEPSQSLTADLMFMSLCRNCNYLQLTCGSAVCMALDGVRTGLAAPAPPAMGAEVAFLPLWLPMRLPSLAETAPRYSTISMWSILVGHRFFVHLLYYAGSIQSS